MNNKVLKIIGIIILVIIIVIGALFLIDLNRMKNNEEVLFSTWGRKYAPVRYEKTNNLENNMNNNEENISNRNINEKKKIEELPQDYNILQAIEDKCVISVHGMKLYNKDELDTFLDKVNKNEPYSIRTISFTTEGEMIINDINFEGNDVFSACCDWTRDEYTSKEDRTYKYGKFSKLVINDIEDSSGIYLDNKIEGDLDQCAVTYFEKNAKVINGYEFKYLFNVKRSDKVAVNKITQGELAKKYDYDIYYYGLENVTINIDNEELDLKQALIDNKVTMEQIIEQAEKDKENDVINADMYKDGGTMMYWYGTYTIIKSYSLDGNRDVYIGIPEMNLNSVR